jgi:hypothetical protein
MKNDGALNVWVGSRSPMFPVGAATAEAVHTTQGVLASRIPKRVLSR